MAAIDERALRERAAYDEENVFERSHAWHYRVRHVLEGPNSVHGEQLFTRALATSAPQRRVLDVGCGGGQSSREVLELGADYVLGIDVSQSMIDQAVAGGTSNRLEFRLKSAAEPLDGAFDLIFGRSVLHHIAFREFLDRAYRDNLAPGGRMVFMEPGHHPMTVMFHRFVRSAHTPDESPLGPRDFHWIRSRFTQTRVYAVNFVSFPAGVISTFACSSADNSLMHIADVIDRALAGRPRLAPYGRQTIIVIDKPGVA